MSLANQLQTRYAWTPSYQLVYKKPAPKGLKTFQVPQTTGQPGWIVLTYEKKMPVCIWITEKECKKLPCIVDERICGDTFLKVEKTGPLDFVVADIWMYNSNCVFACSTFRQRYEWLQKLFSRFTTHVPGVTVNLIHKADIGGLKLRGYEQHNDENIGRPGFFIEKDNSELLDIVRLGTPDCYEVVGRGYLNVPNLKVSLFLRSKGERFKCRCVRHDEEFWNVTENIPELEVNAS
jgi:hypothetical protein